MHLALWAFVRPQGPFAILSTVLAALTSGDEPDPNPAGGLGPGGQGLWVLARPTQAAQTPPAEPAQTLGTPRQASSGARLHPRSCPRAPKTRVQGRVPFTQRQTVPRPTRIHRLQQQLHELSRRVHMSRRTSVQVSWERNVSVVGFATCGQPTASSR